jgi:Ser/Thr protein kinase RdoA (MazF antagonist)
VNDPATIAAAFALGADVLAVRPFGAGLINETFLIETNNGDFVLQRLNTDVFAEPNLVMRNVEVVTEHLQGRYVPELVGTRDGVWRAWRRVSGTTGSSQPTVARVASAARLLAAFHDALADLDPVRIGETLPHFHDPARRFAALQQAIDTDPAGRVAQTTTEIETVLAAAPLVDRAREIIGAVPRRVAHNDAQLNNVLFRGDDAICLVDLDTVMPTAWFWDLGDLLRSASSYGEEDDPEPAHNDVDPALWHAIVDTYCAELTHATAAERAATVHAGAIVTYEQALRFLTDWLAGDIYYRTTRPGQNLDRTRAQLALLASMRGTVGA